MSLSNSKIVILSLCFLLLGGELLKIRLSNNIVIALADIVVFLIVTINIFKKNQWNKLIKSYLKWCLLIFLVMLLSLTIRINSVPTNQILIALLYPIRWIYYFCLPIILFPLLQNVQFKEFTLKWLKLTLFLLAVIGLLQLIVLPDLSFLEKIGYDPHYFRAVSTWLDPNYLGAVLVFGILLLVATKQKQKIDYIFLITLIVCLITTFSRSAYIMLFIALFIFSVLTKSKKTATLLIFTAIFTALIFYFPRKAIETNRNINRTFSAQLRLISINQAYTLLTENPFLGCGYNLLRFEKNTKGWVMDTRQGGNAGSGLDSSWLVIPATLGLLGSLLFISFWIRLAYFVIDPLQDSKLKLFKTSVLFLQKASLLQKATLSLFISLSVNALFINSLFYAPLLLVWGIIFSIALAEKTTD